MRACFRMLKLSQFLLMICLWCMFGSILVGDDTPTTKGPNVIFILADDLGWGDVGCFGQTKIPTPNIDALARRGIRLTQHYSGAPVCAPSRCVLMTGKHLGHAEIRGNQQAKVRFPQFSEGQHPISAEAITLAEQFRKLGYRTAAFGKWGLGPVGSTGDPNQQGFDTFFGYNCQAVAHSFYPTHLWHNSEKVPLNSRAIPGHKKQPEGEVKLQEWIGEQYAPARMIDEAEKFLGQQGEQPFFLYLPFIEPHVAMHPPASSVEKFPVEWDSVSYRGQCGYLPHPRPRAAYAAMISDLDGYVGRILKLVEEKKLAESTLIIFSSDNGATHAHAGDPNFHVGGVDAKFFNSTAGLRGYKGSVYEGGIRVPTIVSWPGVLAENVSNHQPSYFADWFPTLCEATRSEPPDQLDGQSIWRPLLENKAVTRTRPMLWVFPEYSGQVAVRIGDFKVIKQGLKTKQPGQWQVYNLANDSGEQTNVANQHPELIQRAIEILKAESSDNEIFALPIPTE
jgi:arylsulfatase A